MASSTSFDVNRDVAQDVKEFLFRQRISSLDALKLDHCFGVHS